MISSIVKKDFSLQNVKNMLKLSGYTNIEINKNFTLPRVYQVHGIENASRFDARSKNGRIVLFIFKMNDGETRFTGIGSRLNVTDSNNFDELIRFIGTN